MSNAHINEGSYAQYEGFDSYSYQCITYLMNNDELIWRLLKYKTPDAWEESVAQPNLTQEQKGGLIYNGTDDTSKFNVFLDMGSPDVITREDCILRISPHSIFPENRTIGTINIIFEVYSHYHINTMTNYKTRIDMVTKRLLQVFNGKIIPQLGIGRLYFDRLASEANRLEWAGQQPQKGRWIIMSNKSP